MFAFNGFPIGRRSTSEQAPLSHTMQGLLVVLLVLCICALLLVACLLLMRQRRRALQRQLLPLYDEKRSSVSSNTSHRRVMVRPAHSIVVYQEKQQSGTNTSKTQSPSNELPEIRITFPEEFDDSGKRKSGRVVVVHVGDAGVGLEPTEEQLPAYGAGERFHSLDLERIGGMVEMARNAPPKSAQ